MKKILIAFIVAASSQFLIGQENYTVQDNSKATWTGRSEVGGYSQNGSIDISEGKVLLEGNQIISASLTFNTKSISHSDKKLEKHLKDPDFFKVKEFPTAVFIMDKIEGSIVSGQLTIRGKTNPVSFPFEMKLNDGQINLKGKVTIDRTKYDIKYNSASYLQDLGNYAIDNDFDLDFDLVFDK